MILNDDTSENEPPIEHQHNHRSTHSHQHSSIDDEVALGASFQTDWSMGQIDGKSGKRRRAGGVGDGGVTPSNSHLPLKLDSRGQVKGLVITGPVSTKRVKF